MERGMCALFVGRALLGISQLTASMPDKNAKRKREELSNVLATMRKVAAKKD